jgi:hypothetical protein
MSNNWDLGFISREDFKEHIKNTIKQYGATLKSINLKKFNENIIDPIKLTFDSKVYRKSIQDVIVEEISRQRDKSNNNAIGYFHQNMFKYIEKCEVPLQGFDIVVSLDNKKIFVEMKNKHNTMNSSSSKNTFIKMMNQILLSPNYYCYLVEIIAKRSQNINWTAQVDGNTINNDRIRRVSIDHFYSEVTGDHNAFMKICKNLPIIVDEILLDYPEIMVEVDTVFEEIKEIDEDFTKALYKLAFSSYLGFEIL